MADMMADAPADIDTREGSLFYNACSRQAIKLEEAFIQMDLILDNMIVDTMDEEHLTTYGNERGVIRNAATAATVKGVFSQEIEIGARFLLNNYTYIVTSKLSDYTYVLTCETPGDEANSNIGEIEPIEYIDEYAGGSITEILTPGTPLEDLEEYRTRVITSFNTKSFGGNRAQYTEYMNALPYVGGCKVTRRKEGEENITIYFQSETYGVPTPETVEKAQTEIDPTINSGEGYGLAPICHKVKIQGVTGVTVNISTKITFDSGFSFDSLQETINGVIDDYLMELNKTWQGSDALIVRIAMIESKIMSIDGVIDITETTINDASENLTLDQYAVCERGVINAI